MMDYSKDDAPQQREVEYADGRRLSSNAHRAIAPKAQGPVNPKASVNQEGLSQQNLGTSHRFEDNPYRMIASKLQGHVNPKATFNQREPNPTGVVNQQHDGSMRVSGPETINQVASQYHDDKTNQQVDVPKPDSASPTCASNKRRRVARSVRTSYPLRRPSARGNQARGRNKTNQAVTPKAVDHSDRKGSQQGNIQQVVNIQPVISNRQSNFHTRGSVPPKVQAFQHGSAQQDNPFRQRGFLPQDHAQGPMVIGGLDYHQPHFAPQGYAVQQNPDMRAVLTPRATVPQYGTPYQAAEGYQASISDARAPHEPHL